MSMLFVLLLILVRNRLVGHVTYARWTGIRHMSADPTPSAADSIHSAGALRLRLPPEKPRDATIA